ncbi:glycosyltransferase family 39 protein [Sphingomonas bacterium]|uniref:ArnT family glycosyltransferase n=1 Tax=Sphingomonas bacterium TaxID=1895847 RepID=UPI001577582D|nr:glycosyltransferase family 39 protein [Sphingomonas bacterium]
MSTPPIPGHPGASTRRRDWTVVLGVLILSALFLFGGPARPIVLWDESRNIINALEMDRRGLGVVTTWRGAPDLWNTKPPLMIWLMVGSVRLFGASVWALRLPGMIATLGTIALVMTFVRRTTGSIATGALAAAFLVASPALFGEHGAGTADYDSLLVFFVTAYLLLLFGAIHRARPRVSTLVLAGGCVVGAMLTKGVAGAMPGLGVGTYLMLTRRLPRIARWRYGAIGAAIAAAVLVFLTVREVAAPGYLAASWHNDVAGRLTDSLVGARKPATFYLAILWAGYFSAPLLLIVAPFAWRTMPGRARAVSRYGLCIVGTLLLTTTIAASKLHHYILPAMPFMAIVAAIVSRAIRRRIRADRDTVGIALAIVGVLCTALAIERGVVQRYVVDPRYEGAASGRYGALFDRLAGQPLPIVAVDPGFADHGDPHYAPVLHAYRLLWRRRGVWIGWATGPGDRHARPAVLASCDPPTAARLLRRGADIGQVAGCAAVVGG